MFQHDAQQEPVVAVGLIDRAEAVSIHLDGDYRSPAGAAVGSGELHVRCHRGVLRCTGRVAEEASVIEWNPTDPDTGQFSLEATIGIGFHWQKRETEAFRGGLRIIPGGDDRVTVINHVPMETYLESVVCSEMRAGAPAEFVKAHAVISRSWLLAQLNARAVNPPQAVAGVPRGGVSRQERPAAGGRWIRWTDRAAHADFDVCADDHCQRYQGIGRVTSPGVAAAVAATRGVALTYQGKACDTRYSKCCGGVTEQFQTAWGDEAIPYLVAVLDGPDGGAIPPDLREETAMRHYIESPPAAYCNCSDPAILARVLNDDDRSTEDFFRWRVALDVSRASTLIAANLGVDLGRLLAMEPIERGASGRLKQLRLQGEAGSLVIGKELEIRRVLSTAHLYSSAFVVEPIGLATRPEAFVLKGAGWGHGVGLCQIGAAVLAWRGMPYEKILAHYYPGTEVDRLYH